MVVAGAPGCIGKAITERLAADGWNVAATDLTVPAAESAPGSVLSLAMDVADRASIAGILSELSRRQHGIAGLVRAAGVLQDVVLFLDMEGSAQQRIFDVSHFGTMRRAHIFAAAMVKAGIGGSIVTITSVNEHRPLPLHAYAPGKAALGALTAIVAGELGRNRIRANAIAPGFTLAPVFAAKIAARLRDASILGAYSALGRLVSVEPDLRVETSAPVGTVAYCIIRRAGARACAALTMAAVSMPLIR